MSTTGSMGTAGVPAGGRSPIPQGRAAQGAMRLAVSSVDVTRLVKFTAQPEGMRTRWRVAAAQTRYFNRVGTLIGVLQIKNVRGATGFLVEFDNGELAAFADMDLFPEPTQAGQS